LWPRYQQRLLYIGCVVVKTFRKRLVGTSKTVQQNSSSWSIVVQQQRAPLIMCCMLKPAMITTTIQATGFGNQTMYPYCIKDTR
jgi:hypothetical protein